MSPVSLTLDLLLAGLLLITLIFGLRLDKRLKTLNASQEEFQAAVADLDRAAARAEAGLADLRASMDEAVDLLGGRIEKARDLAGKLETLTMRAESAGQRVAAAVRAGPAAPSPAAAPALSPAPALLVAPERRSGIDRIWGRPADKAAPVEVARAAAEPLTLTRQDAVQPNRLSAQPLRSRALVDDELFEGPGLRRSAGGRS
jgi:hypothetical protein